MVQITIVVKWDGTEGLQDSIIFDNGTNVGIGTYSPNYKLDVDGKVTSKYRFISNQFQAKTSFGIVFKNSSGNDLAFMSDSGNVGIGTTSPAPENTDVNGKILMGMKS